MLDVQMLEQLARPVNGVVIGPHPPRLHEVFARVAADGWHPRTPAFEPELSRLEASRVRGYCTSPLLLDGDTIFVDKHTPARSGDLVSFRLSARGSEAQNRALPPGQSPWKAGDRWAKLLIDYRTGDRMLLDRFGSAATATLLAAESADDTPVLWPVRNIVRGNRLLFTPPDSYAGEIGLNAATTVSETTANATLTTAIAAIVSQTVGPFRVAVTLVVTMSGTFSVQNTSSSVQVNAEVAYALSTLSGSLPAGHPFFDVYSVPAATTVTQNFTYEQAFSLAANTSATYNFNATNINTTNNVITCSLMMKIEAIAR